MRERITKGRRGQKEGKKGVKNGGREAEGRRGRVTASFQLFARHGPGHPGNTSPAAKGRKTREERTGWGEVGKGDGEWGRKKACFGRRKMFCPLPCVVKC